MKRPPGKTNRRGWGRHRSRRRKFKRPDTTPPVEPVRVYVDPSRIERDKS